MSTANAKHKAGRKAEKKTANVKQRFPPGWDEEKIRKVIDHYDNQTDEERAAEIIAAQEAAGHTMVSVPTELVPKVVALIKRHQKSACVEGEQHGQSKSVLRSSRQHPQRLV